MMAPSCFVLLRSLVVLEGCAESLVLAPEEAAKNTSLGFGHPARLAGSKNFPCLLTFHAC
jgi:hypothetical protein